MITETGYSNEPSYLADGIAVTFGASMIAEQGGLLNFLKGFNDVMENAEKGDYWMHKLKNKPSVEVDHVYVIVANRLYCRCFFGGYTKEPAMAWTMDGRDVEISWGRIILSGPIVKAPFKRTLRGFQGFRYTKKLF